MEDLVQKEFFTGEKTKKETPPKQEEEKTIYNIPAGVVISGEPAFKSSAFIRYTEEGESFPWEKAVPNDGALWYKRKGAVEHMPTKLGRKKGEEIVFLGPLRKEIRRKPKKEGGQTGQYPMPGFEK